jgi:hypothetical protein
LAEVDEGRRQGAACVQRCDDDPAFFGPFRQVGTPSSSWGAMLQRIVPREKRIRPNSACELIHRKDAGGRSSR